MAHSRLIHASIYNVLITAGSGVSAIYSGRNEESCYVQLRINSISMKRSIGTSLKRIDWMDQSKVQRHADPRALQSIPRRQFSQNYCACMPFKLSKVLFIDTNCAIQETTNSTGAIHSNYHYTRSQLPLLRFFLQRAPITDQVPGGENANSEAASQDSTAWQEQRHQQE